jgi:exopolysaccharide biosynthesis polyprenyl glycosylphosphotransferase
MSTVLRKGLQVAPGADAAETVEALRAATAPAGPLRTRARYVAVLVLADLATALAVILLWQHTLGPVADDSALPVLPVLWVGVLASHGWYAGNRGGSDSLLRAAVYLTGAGWFFALAVGHRLPGEVIGALAALCTLGSVTHRWVLHSWADRRGVALPGHRRRVVVVGHHGAVAELQREVTRARGCGLEVVGVCLLDAHASPSTGSDIPVAAGLGHLHGVVAMAAADTVVLLPCSHLDATTVRRTAWQLESHGTRLVLGTPLHGVAVSRTRLAGAVGLPMLDVRHARLAGPGRVVKEVWERCAAALALLVLSPLLLGLMLVVRLDSPGPALFRQTRIGRGDQPFPMLKLRTMAVDAETLREHLAQDNEADGTLFKIRLDPRVTRVGKFLRSTSLDELPQLVNVVRGQMALVGPRPALPTEVAAYEHDVRRRLVVKPGITGLWQVSGRSDLPWDEAVRLDQSYVDNWSLRGDLSILLRTVGAVVGRRGAY